MAAALNRDLARIGRMLIWWRAQFTLLCSVAAILGSLWIFSLLDLFVQYGRLGRFTTWSLLITLVVITCYWIRKTMAHRLPPLAVAAELERSFPELDNHLINYLQFSHNPDRNPFKAAYVKQGAPKYSALELKRMRNKQRLQRGMGGMALAIALLLLPSAFIGKAWATAVWRVVNPFSNVQPVCLTHILEVNPENTTRLKGESVILSCSVQGAPGHDVRLDVDPNDGAKTTYSLGSIDNRDPQTFSHRIQKLGTDLRYRFRAGDAPDSDWFAITARPPLAFTDLKLALTPPEYTEHPPTEFDAASEKLELPVGSEATLSATCNSPLETLSLAIGTNAPVPMTSEEATSAWSQTFTVSDAGVFRLKATDAHGGTLEQRIVYTPKLDLPPAIEIIEPAGRTILSPGEHPSIAFRVRDDYGLSDVILKQVPQHGTTGAIERGRWQDLSDNTLHQTWNATTIKSDGGALEFRIVARDNCPFNSHETVSASIFFNAESHAEASKKREQLENKAFAGLQKILDLQRRNIATTTKYTAIAPQVSAKQWHETADRQREIRSTMKALLDNPVKPLGKLTSRANKLYVNEMADAITKLADIPDTKKAARTNLSKKALYIEQKILRQLKFAESAATDAKLDRRLSALGAMIAALIDGQKDVVKQTQAHIQTSSQVAAPLVDQQDDLGSDLTDFKSACAREAGKVKANDPAFATTIENIGNQCTEKKIRDDMFLAADRLDRNNADKALPFQQAAITKLQALQAMLDSVEVASEAEKRVEMRAAIGQAKEKIQKAKKLHKKVLEAMDMVKTQEDLSDEMVDMMEEEFEEIKRNTKEAMLEIPNDLHIFTDLNAANDLVEDIFAIFEEVEFTEDEDGDGMADDVKPADVAEIAFAKEEKFLDEMDEAEDNMDAWEQWLGDDGDKLKVETEAFDKEEMPEEGMALGALPSEVEDLIGDLQDQDEETNEAADDAATNRGLTDFESGGEVIEGDLSNFSGKGKSGNDRPDHKEQDGRSNVGRQGMSVGETSAGSGTIGEGDENIEERRTQDGTQSGQVDLDGEADTKATGGGKLATGKADELGMGGGVKRMDSNEAGSWEGMAALMAKEADATYAKASMKNIRADSLKTAAHHLRQSGDAIAKGDIKAMKEYRKRALVELQRAKAELAAGPRAGFAVESKSNIIDDVVEGGPDNAPPKYRDLVADYYKRLNDTL